ncbi:Ribokinase [Deinococcus proteolyticus MRP]|uniref:Ribokinase n=1 Tax=Deinococcus proteolyticus (strain ATCC 35074 / DSM 20540 / JCM 6276 / NBRC 101906 / NCIMB 13154 / VKM Ac-1939 / CCM 2703 / MRP) TaxID=693977 RepID=F0RJP2_DEIPM|nr:ribokinase [Deinococcus proteolyticus]ADY26612.1 Ribokinase [Deinococcus proteolyticus MRP]
MILVAGSANLDFVTRLPHLPAPGETVLGQTYRTAPGGKGANQAVACARAGAQTAFVGALGRDPFAEPLLASLQESGVQDRTIRLDAPTGAAFITVSEDGENSIAVAAGANALLAPEHLPDLSRVTHLLLQLEVALDTVQAFSAAAQATGVQVMLNAAPAQALPVDLLKHVNLLLVNEGELETLVGDGELEAQLRRAQAAGPQTVVVTLGERGCLAVEGTELMRLPAHRVEVKDTTAAGDTFAGVLAAALASGQPLRRALEQATVASALTCTREGAQPSIPWADETAAALAEYRRHQPPQESEMAHTAQETQA